MEIYNCAALYLCRFTPVRIYTCADLHLREFTPARIYKPCGKTPARNYKPRGFTPTAKKHLRGKTTTADLQATRIYTYRGKTPARFSSMTNAACSCFIAIFWITFKRKQNLVYFHPRGDLALLILSHILPRPITYSIYLGVVRKYEYIPSCSMGGSIKTRLKQKYTNPGCLPLHSSRAVCEL